MNKGGKRPRTKTTTNEHMNHRNDLIKSPDKERGVSHFEDMSSVTRRNPYPVSGTLLTRIVPREANRLK